MEIKEDLDSTGVALVSIGSGTPEDARHFMETFSYRGEMYLDPALGAYRSFDLKRSFWKTLGPSPLMRGLKAMKEGFRQGRSAGDLWQQGGLFVIGPGNSLLFEHVNGMAGDQADLHAVLRAASQP
ncbi:AhpC/TSA family protein [Desulfobotulus sp. H1]|uniref:AhpC/TSA family protein n=3 Tax=Desulfobotulus pelophilus TaxID=2823377 RepID=A0ABT3N9K7_9BACT|nr:AhpC/TSA family protein [Desulfobotulus pelophilus]